MMNEVIFPTKQDLENYFQSIKKYKKIIDMSKLKIIFYSFLIFFIWFISDIIFCYFLFQSLSLQNAIIFSVTTQLSFIIIYYCYIKLYYFIKKNTNNKINKITNLKTFQEMYYYIWNNIKKNLQLSLSMSDFILNNPSGIKKYLTTSEYSLINGRKLNPNVLSTNILKFNDDKWTISFYILNKNSRFDSLFYFLNIGHIQLATKAYNKTNHNSVNNKERKQLYSSFINYQFYNSKKWNIKLNSFLKRDLIYLQNRGISIIVGDYDLTFCINEKISNSFSPGLGYLVGNSKWMKKYNLNDITQRELIISKIQEKIKYDLESFLEKYYLTKWFVNKYYGELKDEKYYLIEYLNGQIKNSNF